ncbi:hypothetical protein HNP37_004598 [Flavobacterium nitrogenifigens]|uniref:Uncharacterized protein n=2 Tax=Flavobacterium TaxID=237 RepID=A0A7W7J1G5_9FLAO|nr:hypothetical protein [Flavobacterium nitrogenifigens]MBB6389366.1 hypothetical protein [Flavobacterium notoginsengisoli]
MYALYSTDEKYYYLRLTTYYSYFKQEKDYIIINKPHQL